MATSPQDVVSIEVSQPGQQATALGFALADSIHYLDESHWHQLTAGCSVFMSREYLAALEESGTEGIAHRYAIAFRGQEPVVAVAAQVVTVTATQLRRISEPRMQPVERAAQKMRDRALSVVRSKILVCGNLFSWGQHGAACAEGQPPEFLWTTVGEALNRIRQAEKALGATDYVLIKDIPGDDAACSAALRPFDYRPLQTDPEMSLAISPSWSSYDDYLASMNKKYRKAAQQVSKQVEQSGCTVERLDDPAPVAERLHALYQQVQQRADVRLTSLSPGHIPALARHLGPDRFQCTVIRRDGEILGFVTTVRDGETLVGYYLGLDYSVNAEVPLYFRLLHAVIAEGIAQGCRRISFGRTALEAKARLGACPMPMQVWVRQRIPLLNVVIEPLLRTVPHAEPPARNPFKDVTPD